MHDRVRHILLIRHGQTDANRDGIVQGHQPTPLNELGHRQAQMLARRLAQYTPPVDVLVSSDLLRAVQTSRPIAAAINRIPQYDSAWRERCYGTFEGKGRDERMRLRESLGIGDGLPPGAQTERDFQHQVMQSLHALPGQYPDANCIAVVTHAGAVRAVTMHLTDVDEADHQGSYRPCPNCSITHLLCVAGDGRMRFELHRVHDVGHLELEETTNRDSG